MIEIKQLRFTPAQPRVAQPHRYVPPFEISGNALGFRIDAAGTNPSAATLRSPARTRSDTRLWDGWSAKCETGWQLVLKAAVANSGARIETESWLEPAQYSPIGGRGESLAHIDADGSARTRMRPGSTTEKCPGQSSRPVRTSAMTLPTTVGPSAGRRNSTIPQLAGKLELHASSPKSLSKVSSTRAAHGHPLSCAKVHLDRRCPAHPFESTERRAPRHEVQ